MRLADRWQDGPTAYLGLAIAGFPNLLTVNGPCNPAVLTNVPAAIEHDVEWIARCIEYAEQHELTAIEPTAEAEREWVDHTAEIVRGTMYMKANSWWLGANIPGKPRVFMPYPGGVGTYRTKCNEVRANGYEGFVLDAERRAEAVTAG